MSGVGSSPALATCETSQVLLAGVPGGFSQGSPVFVPPTDLHTAKDSHIFSTKNNSVFAFKVDI